MKVLAHGRIHYTKWTDATGTDRYGCEIIAGKVDFLSRPKSAEGQDPSWSTATTRSRSKQWGSHLGPGGATRWALTCAQMQRSRAPCDEFRVRGTVGAFLIPGVI